MSLLRTDVVTHVRTLADATGATKDWPAAFVLLLATRAYDREWAGLLDVVPFYRTAVRTVTAASADAAAGGILLTALDGGSGATAERTYRVLQVALGSRPLVATAPEQLPFVAACAGAQYAVTGARLVVPGLAAGDVLTVLVNHRPPLVSDLADSDLVAWPDGADLIPLAETAALLLAKGGRQPGEADTLVAMAETERQQLYPSLQRPTGGALRLVDGGTVTTDPRDVGANVAGWNGVGGGLGGW